MNLTLMLKLVDVVAWHIMKYNSCFVSEKFKDNFFIKKTYPMGVMKKNKI